jgi:hypothetical protein
MRVDRHTCRCPHPRWQALLVLTERVTTAQPDELRYADPLMAHPPTSQVIQDQGRHNREVGMIGVLLSPAARSLMARAIRRRGHVLSPANVPACRGKSAATKGNRES